MMNLHKNTSPKRFSDFAVLDIGSSKVCCAIAKIDEQSTSERPQFKIMGFGQQISRGLRSGSIVNLEALENSILNAVHTAEQMADETITELYVNVPAGFSHSHMVISEIPLGGQTIDETHLRRLLNLGRANPVPADCQIIHALPISYTIDNIDGIRDPKDMVGNTLSVTLHLLSAPSLLLRNIQWCVGRCHLNITGFVCTPYASGLSTLVEDELELGATLVDIGGGTTTIASFMGGALVYIDSIPVGGNHITNDIARGLSTSVAQAERLKALYGTLFSSSVDEREMIYAPQIGEVTSPYSHQIPKSFLTNIIKARVEEVLELVSKQLRHVGIDCLVGQKFVFCGGSSQLPGLRELAMTFWNKPVRIAPTYGVLSQLEVVQNPMFATLVGLLYYAWKDYIGLQKNLKLNSESKSFIKKTFRWFQENF